MKNIFKYIIPCLAVAFALTSCDSTMDDKASIDAQYAKATNTTAAVADVVAVDYQSVAATGTVSSVEDVVEVGIQVSTTADFSTGVKSVPNDTIETSFTLAANGLNELTEYYVRAYAVTRAGGTVVSPAATVSTPKTPIFPLDGDYACYEYSFDQDNEEWVAPEGAYKVTVEFDAEDPTIVNITNLWGGGMTVQGVYNEKTGVVTVPNYSVVYVHPTYGDVWMRGVKDDISAYTSDVKFQFTTIGGKLVSQPWAALCSAGRFGFVYVSMEHL